MKSVAFIVLLIVAATWADDTYIAPIIGNSTVSSNNMQQAIASDLSLKMMMVEDGTLKGKCYCSCSLNNQPVFMEIDPSTLFGTEMMTIA